MSHHRHESDRRRPHHASNGDRYSDHRPPTNSGPQRSNDDHRRHSQPDRHSGHHGHPRDHRDDDEDRHRPAHRRPPIKREQSRSPDTKAKRHRMRRANDEADDGTHEWGKRVDTKAGVKDEVAEAPVEKELPNFGLSGKLTEETNKVNGVVLKYAEPDEARKPKRRWRLYAFKGAQALPTLFIHRQSCFLVGRDRKICDIPVDHPSCSKQHAVVQFRLVPYTRDDGTKGKRVRPYILDLESANGSFLNGEQIEARKYIEILEKDVIKFGFSTREYVLLHENSKDEADDDDVLEDASPKPATKTD